MHLRQAMRVGCLDLGQQRQPFGIALQHGVQQGGGTFRRFLAHGRHAGAAGESDIATVDRQFARDGTQ
jgi:hypothetical protein